MFQGYINKILAEKLNVFVIVYLDDILIYTKNKGKKHIEAVWWMLEQLQKHLLYANLKKCQFHQEEVRFLGSIITYQSIQKEEKQIKAINDWLNPQSVRDIQVFLGFANFYQQFIQGFNKLATPLTSMLKKISVVGPTASVEVGDKKEDGKEIQVDGDEKEPTQVVKKSCKG